jgi:hypothetical protein
LRGDVTFGSRAIKQQDRPRLQSARGGPAQIHFPNSVTGRPFFAT